MNGPMCVIGQTHVLSFIQYIHRPDLIVGLKFYKQCVTVTLSLSVVKG